MILGVESSVSSAASRRRVLSIMEQHLPDAAASDRIVRLPFVLDSTGLTKSTIYRLIAARRFPSPVRLAGRAVGWRQADLDQWREQLTTTAAH